MEAILPNADGHHEDRTHHLIAMDGNVAFALPHLVPQQIHAALLLQAAAKEVPRVALVVSLTQEAIQDWRGNGQARVLSEPRNDVLVVNVGSKVAEAPLHIVAIIAEAHAELLYDRHDHDVNLLHLAIQVLRTDSEDLCAALSIEVAEVGPLRPERWLTATLPGEQGEPRVALTPLDFKSLRPGSVLELAMEHEDDAIAGGALLEDALARIQSLGFGDLAAHCVHGILADSLQDRDERVAGEACVVNVVFQPVSQVDRDQFQVLHLLRSQELHLRASGDHPPLHHHRQLSVYALLVEVFLELPEPP
mmetsp:Transcript_47329/g.103552  ORF Transcript_47329/g.103552 Transcript_47329/m.103552 type:complete len:306 (-) Transcript_47329:564-1481(-)